MTAASVYFRVSLTLGSWSVRTRMRCVLPRLVPVSACRDMQIRSDLFDFNTPVYPARWTILDLLVCRSVRNMLFLDASFVASHKEFADTRQRSALIRCAALGGIDNLGG